VHILIICTFLSFVQFLSCLFTYYLCWIYVLEVRINIIIIIIIIIIGYTGYAASVSQRLQQAYYYLNVFVNSHPMFIKLHNISSTPKEWQPVSSLSTPRIKPGFPALTCTDDAIRADASANRTSLRIFGCYPCSNGHTPVNRWITAG